MHVHYGESKRIGKSQKGKNHSKSHFLDIIGINISMCILQRYDYVATDSFYVKSTLDNVLVFTFFLMLHHGKSIIVFTGYISFVESDAF